MDKTDDGIERHVYICQVSFYEPNSGTMKVFAKDEADARDLLPKLVPAVKDLVIHSVFKEDLIAASTADTGSTPPSMTVH